MLTPIKKFQILMLVIAAAVTGEHSRAADGCAGFLKRSLLAGHALASGEAGALPSNRLSSKSEQYVRLIEYALEKTVDPSERQRLL